MEGIYLALMLALYYWLAEPRKRQSPMVFYRPMERDVTPKTSMIWIQKGSNNDFRS